MCYSGRCQIYCRNVAQMCKCRAPAKHVVCNLTAAALFANNCGAPIVATFLKPAPAPGTVDWLQRNPLSQATGLRLIKVFSKLSRKEKKGRERKRSLNSNSQCAFVGAKSFQTNGTKWRRILRKKHCENTFRLKAIKGISQVALELNKFTWLLKSIKNKEFPSSLVDGWQRAGNPPYWAEGCWDGLPPAVESGHERDSELQEEKSGWRSSPKTRRILG